jgi:hypothetical protein
MSTSTPPGWYDDGSDIGTQRWWNGDAWTEHAQTATVSAPEATQAKPPDLADPFTQPLAATGGAQHGRPGKPRGKGWTKGRVIGGGIVTLFAIVVVAAIVDGPPEDPSAVTVASEGSASPTAKSSTTQAAKPAAAKTTAKPAAKPSSSATTAKPKPVPKATYKKITDRQWKVISKDPDSHFGETYVVYGYVTQFDSITGDEQFLANVSGARHTEWYEYDTNTILGGTKGVLSKVVEDDIFRAEVMVAGTTKYETAMGAETTVPTLLVANIKVIGSTS